MLACSQTEIEQTIRNARLLFEKLAKVLDSPTEETEKYRMNIENLVAAHKAHENITQLKTELASQHLELSKLL